MRINVSTEPPYAPAPWRTISIKAVAAAVGYACIRLLKMIADKGKFGFFAYYCWIVGAITLVLTVIQN